MTDAAPADLWTELALRALPAQVEALADRLRELTGAGVTIVPPIEALGPDEGYTLDPDAPMTLKAYLHGEIGAAQRDSLQRALTDAGFGEIDWRVLREEDWANAWKAYYDIEHVGRVVIRPAWLDYAPVVGEVVVSLDPGMAFGTGQHPTTRMCLQALQELIKPGDLVFDLGTGSGILGLAALALGAGSVLAADVDQIAVTQARRNLALNGLGTRMAIVEGSIEAAFVFGSFDLVLANINAATLTSLSGQLARVVKKQGALVAGGIIEERAADCIAALLDAGFSLERRLAEGDWRSFVLRKP